jgi:hypothetical protein
MPFRALYINDACSLTAVEWITGVFRQERETWCKKNVRFFLFVMVALAEMDRRFEEAKRARRKK